MESQPEDEFDSEASLREVYTFPLSSQGNIYCLSTLPCDGSHKLLVGTLKRKMYCLEFDRHHLENLEEGPNHEFRDLQFTYIPSGAEIISMDAFKRTAHGDDFVIGITIIKLQSNDSSIGENGTGGGGQYLNIYSDWEQPLGSGRVSTGFYLENLSQSCLSIELDFIPYQLTHCEVPFRKNNGSLNIETVFVLLGSDRRAHLYIEDRQSHSYIDAKEEADVIRALFPEFDRLFPSIPIWVDFFYFHDKRQRLTAIGCEDGEYFLTMVDLNQTPAAITLRDEGEFEESVSQLKFYKEYEDTLDPPDGVLDNQFILKPSPINLVVLATDSPAIVFQDVEQNGLKCGKPLPRSDDYDVPTSLAVCDVDFDGEKEIVIGTFGQELLLYKMVERLEEVKPKPTEQQKVEPTDKDDEPSSEVDINPSRVETEKKLVRKWELYWSRSLFAPVFCVRSFDLTGDGIQEIVVSTSRGVQILQHDLRKVQDLLHSRYHKYLEKAA